MCVVIPKSKKKLKYDKKSIIFSQNRLVTYCYDLKLCKIISFKNVGVYIVHPSYIVSCYKIRAATIFPSSPKMMMMMMMIIILYHTCAKGHYNNECYWEESRHVGNSRYNNDIRTV